MPLFGMIDFAFASLTLELCPRLKIIFELLIVRYLLCYQVIDPFYVDSDFNTLIILATLHCLQQAFLQSIYC